MSEQLESLCPSNAAACSPSSAQEPEQEKCGTTHYAGCPCHEKGWENKWECAVEMAARAQIERDQARAALEAIEERYIDGCDTYEDWKFMGDTARAFLSENVQGMARREGRPPCEDGLSPSPSPSCSPLPESPKD